MIITLRLLVKYGVYQVLQTDERTHARCRTFLTYYCRNAHI